MRKHWMAIPGTVMCLLIAVAIVLWKTEHWSNGALGSVVLGLMGITAVVGTLMIPLDADGNIERRPGRARRRR